MMSSDQQFFLKWNDFQTNMVTSFRHLRDEKSFTDVSSSKRYIFLSPAKPLDIRIFQTFIKPLFILTFFSIKKETFSLSNKIKSIFAKLLKIQTFLPKIVFYTLYSSKSYLSVNLQLVSQLINNLTMDTTELGLNWQQTT